MDQGDLDRLLTTMAHWDASDLHLKAATHPRVRINGDLRPITDEVPFEKDEMLLLAETIMPPRIAEHFEKHHEADFAYQVDGVGRFRVNAFYQMGSVAMVLRRIKPSPDTTEKLGLPRVIKDMAEEHRGLILVTGPTGSGKTTTLAAMIDHINRTRPCHIVTIEDPVEYVHRDQMASIEQREVGFDTDSFASAMRAAMRQDPDVILVGEIRDTETASAALKAAETGHLVFSTLHTINATETINRIIDLFPPHQQHQSRIALSGALKGSIAQRLVRTIDGVGRVPALEIMIVNGRIQQCIATAEKTGEIEEIVYDGEWYGMQTFDQSLCQHFADGKISQEEAMANASKPHDLRVMLEQKGLITTGSGGGGNWEE